MESKNVYFEKFLKSVHSFSIQFSMNFWKTYIYLLELHRGREILCFLMNSQDGFSGQHWARPMPRVRPCEVSTVLLGASCIAFQRCWRLYLLQHRCQSLPWTFLRLPCRHWFQVFKKRFIYLEKRKNKNAGKRIPPFCWFTSHKAIALGPGHPKDRSLPFLSGLPWCLQLGSSSVHPGGQQEVGSETEWLGPLPAFQCGLPTLQGVT